MATFEFTNTSGIQILPYNSLPYPSEIPVSGLNGTISKVTVTIHGLDYYSTPTIDILLVGPEFDQNSNASQRSLLMSEAGAFNWSVSDLTLRFSEVHDS